MHSPHQLGEMHNYFITMINVRLITLRVAVKFFNNRVDIWLVPYY